MNIQWIAFRYVFKLSLINIDKVVDKKRECYNIINIDNYVGGSYEKRRKKSK